LLSWLAVQAGATEVGLLYQGNFSMMAINKTILSVLVVGILVWAYSRWKRALPILATLNIGMLLIIGWNAYILNLQVM